MRQFPSLSGALLGIVGGGGGGCGVIWVMPSDDDAELYRKHGAELIRFATVLAGPSMAEDVFSLAVVRSFESSAWSVVENKRAYLFKAVLREALSQRRSSRRRMLREAALAGRDSVDPVVVDRDVLVALGRLSVRQRAVIFLTYWQDLSPGEVGDVLGWSTRTVERELAAGRRQLEVLLS